MNPNQPNQALSWHRRVLHAVFAGLALLMMPLALLYGAIMTTNTLTHLRHSEAWFYALVWVGCAVLLAVLLWLLWRVFNKHRQLAAGGRYKASQLNSTKSP
ncbi:hypothetical protein [Marinicella meishanensis]|uniref:hypothetical protein n=1 Tax=Marinicella meishanensis TaxID=2873263 RepID=UPI001CBD3EA7|nr:hypothetical protein [Marinicella sp. NBU2979]